MEEILRLFPKQIQPAIIQKLNNRWDKLQEIRVRLNQPIELIFDEGLEWITGARPNKKDSMFIINQLSEFSLYRMEDELREGYVTIEGGHRVGLAGKVNTLNGSVKAIQYITFLNIRIAKQKIGVASKVIPHLYNQRFLNTLFVGPPQSGKTTLIRDVIRIISSGWNHVPPKKVGVVDERSEIAASLKGVPQHDLGKRTDVLDACPKAEGMMMMIRSMSPEILVVDEIGSDKDVHALINAINAGVTIICTIHGQSLEELKNRTAIQPLLEKKMFQRIVILKGQNSPGTIDSIFDEHEVNMYKSRGAFSDEMDRSTSLHRRNDMARIRVE
ncbi:stage III sporulation protein AA [Ornithinibacillus halotolerans]|uniref:Stage III sporulation protein AA n=1 Tax=Ornithinibacillus halotolerans TaxID=1274357 RepID=A0A916W5F7_9BACI|nr:stage III sporulation protein AA [Ornithinibacillus halotolerans]GGA68155.1 stage III sporulation protein AA [Ornithinibacillus halotolerans]